MIALINELLNIKMTKFKKLQYHYFRNWQLVLTNHRVSMNTQGCTNFTNFPQDRRDCFFVVTLRFYFSFCK